MLPCNNTKFAKTFAGPSDRFPLLPVTDGSEDELANDKITVAYWKIRGLAAPLRMMCSYAGVEFENKMYEHTGCASEGFDKKCWTDEAKPVLKERNPLINLP